MSRAFAAVPAAPVAKAPKSMFSRALRRPNDGSVRGLTNASRLRPGAGDVG